MSLKKTYKLVLPDGTELEVSRDYLKNLYKSLKNEFEVDEIPQGPIYRGGGTWPWPDTKIGDRGVNPPWDITSTFSTRAEDNQ